MSDVLVLVDDLTAAGPGTPLPARTLHLLATAAVVGRPVAVHVGEAPLGPTAVSALAAAGAAAVISATAAGDPWERADAVTALLAGLVDERDAVAVLVGAHRYGTDVAARLGVALGTGVVTDAVALEPDRRAHKAVPAAGVTTTVRVDGVLVATLASGPATSAPVPPGTVEPSEAEDGEPTAVVPEAVVPEVVVPQVVGPETAAPRAVVPQTVAPGAAVPHDVVELPTPAGAPAGPRVLERTPRPRTGRPRLTDADIVVAAGRGLAGDLTPVTALADAVGAAVAGSRAAVDAGWLPHEAQVGQTGTTVSPAVYVAVGISGAVQHVAGMSGARTVVAVNSDPQAPIFQVADLGIVGDAFVVLPQVVAALREQKESSR